MVALNVVFLRQDGGPFEEEPQDARPQKERQGSRVYLKRAPHFVNTCVAWLLCKRPWPYRKAPQASWWLWKCWWSAPPPNQLRQVSQQWLDWCVTASLTPGVQQKLDMLESSVSSPAAPLTVAPGTILVTSERPPRMDPFLLLESFRCLDHEWEMLKSKCYEFS